MDQMAMGMKICCWLFNFQMENMNQTKHKPKNNKPNVDDDVDDKDEDYRGRNRRPF